MLQVEEMPFRAGWSYEGGIQQACTGYLLEEEGGGGELSQNSAEQLRGL